MKNLSHREEFRAWDFTWHSTANVLELERLGKFVLANLSIDPHAIPPPLAEQAGRALHQQAGGSAA
jgi:hypothetical protein